jgi:Pyruvate/2-oxoacid:ferredoxin oxidoreductase delta subunit
VAALLGAPALVVPWLDRFLEPAEVGFLLALGSSRRSEQQAREVAARFFSGPPGAALERLYRRGLIDRLDEQGAPAELGEEAASVQVAGFHARFEIWAILEGWKDLPADVRTGLNSWEIDAYEQRKLPQISALRRGEQLDPGLENSEYLLLPEAEAVIDRVEHVYLWPCNCRAMMSGCDKPVNTCLRFDNNRGVGWEISKERAKEVLREASRAGLMHTGELAREGERVTGAICNCCADCCYPHLVAERLDAVRLWPHSRYVARHLPERCTACGRCVRRCPFGAFAWPGGEAEAGPGGRREKRGTEGSRPELDTSVCRGCGVCWVACPDEAIVMDVLQGEDRA